ncbi:phenylalanine--tRNA ligase subunit alpha [Limnochorda pilosa]|uniref:Phenylalanine--tRNA ligase alpha subunit n=1 Tax=Limnochorda pilosa TaxID=1555112 RepID=A0A0K2SND4_LIMPI|nr:phenylalanine--tRNA ligase subunit alpha [Limnochorda pilosa]BAS28334.1 phenylalanyl-tRNA synthetase subunit alpha [Limnochorda pilosa]
MDLEVRSIQEEALAQVDRAGSLDDLDRVRVAYLGRKGRLTQLLRSMGDLPPEERPRRGAEVNEAKKALEAALGSRGRLLAEAEEARRLEAERLDVSLPGWRPPAGHRHPVNLALDEILRFFTGLGFETVEGPEVETDYYNFEALNIPPEHPARDMQDTFYLPGGLLLRTHTSPVQVHTMEARRPPVRVVVPGKVYRRDADATHSPMFHQVEGLLVDRSVSLGDLKGTLVAFARALFGPDRRVRFRPSYFPFTEPSAEMDISCWACGGEGCRLCGGEGWLEILGSGMVHPRVLEMVGYDPGQVSGFAFGMGVERVAMLKYGVEDIRLFYDNDLRFLASFPDRLVEPARPGIPELHEEVAP